VTEVSNTSTILTYNYAISGSVVDKSVVDVAGSTSSSLVEEVQTFTTWDKAAKRAWTSADALFSAWVSHSHIRSHYLISFSSASTTLVSLSSLATRALLLLRELFYIMSRALFQHPFISG
jgi:hypothetical protein